MLVVKMGQDGHDRGAKVIATAFADIGFDVDVGPLFQTPGGGGAGRDRQRRARGRHLVARRPGTRRWRRSSSRRCGRRGAGDILVICGGVIPQQDYGFLKDAGVSAIFGPGTNIPEAAREILELIRARMHETASPPRPHPTP